MLRWRVLAVAGLLVLGLGSLAPALAAGAADLAPGGRTLAGPASTTIAASATLNVFSYGDRDACATVTNTGRSTVQMQAVGNDTSSIDVPAGGTRTLCDASLEDVYLTCTGTKSCTAQWRVDSN